jgi:hypothetical protein
VGLGGVLLELLLHCNNVLTAHLAIAESEQHEWKAAEAEGREDQVIMRASARVLLFKF